MDDVREREFVLPLLVRPLPTDKYERVHVALGRLWLARTVRSLLDCRRTPMASADAMSIEFFRASPPN